MGEPRQRRARWLEVLALGVAATLGVACLYDPDDRCGPNQVLADYNRCQCTNGTVAIDGRCVDCGPNSRVEGGACACLAGFERATPESDCEAIATGLGEPCVTATDCAAPEYPVCQSEGAAGYCTSRCSATADCAGGYACRTRAAEPFCERPPTGLGASCRTSGECAGFEASFCENVVTSSCVVAGCAADEQCHGDWVCCDFTSLGFPVTLCVPPEECVTQ